MTDQPTTAIPGVPDEAPADLVEDVACQLVGTDESLLRHARPLVQTVLAAAVPHVREQIAREIENRVATGGATRDYWRSPQEIKADAAAIARGVSR